MNITHIRTFWEVMKCQSFTEAAERLYTTQSTVSKNISALEKELGFLLFERRGRTVLLTPNGKKLLKSFGELLTAYEKAQSAADEIRRTGRPSGCGVRMMMVPSVERLGLVAKINRFAARTASFQPSIEIADEKQVILGLQSGYCDVAFCSDLALDERLYHLEPHSLHGFHMVMSKTHPFAEREYLRMRDLEGQKLILMHPESMLWDLCVSACESAGFYPEVVLTTCRPDIAMDCVRSSECMYMNIDFEAADCVPEDCTALPLLDGPRFRYVLAWRKGADAERQLLVCADSLKGEGLCC